MANPQYMAQAFANGGAKTDPIPNTTNVLGRASLLQGFPTETSLPLAQGGVPPRREDFNGILYALSSYSMFQQSGGIITYDSRVDYTPPAIVFYGSDLWWCKASNGASSTVVTPGTNTTYWIKLKDYLANPLAAYPVGAYYISSSSTSPATLFGGTWVQIQNRMIMAAGSSYSVGATGGSATKTLVTNNIPSHSHSCGSAGSHTHAKGTMRITGELVNSASDTDMLTLAEDVTGTGALRVGDKRTKHKGGATVTTETGCDSIIFDSNRAGAWTGETATSGSHSHTIGSTGKGTAFDIMPPYIVAYVWRRTA